MKIFKSISIIAAASLFITSCDKYLDVMPDNRTEIDSKEKIQALLTSAYPETDYMLLTSFSSDDVDDYGANNPNHDRFIDQVFHWQDLTETDNEDSESLWGNSYMAIASANKAIESIEEMGGAEANEMTAEMAEALLCRAYNHFVLVNVFSQAYNSETSATDPGITYMTYTETELLGQYERASVAEVYEAIDNDIQAALPWVSDSYYSVPKYHFNKKAAFAFAARFYLYYEKWEESIKYANLCLGSSPASLLRDWKAQASMAQDFEVITEHFIDATLGANLILMTAYSKMGLCFTGPYSVYSRYAHGTYLAENETGIALATLLGSTNESFYHSGVKLYTANNHDKATFWKLPFLFEYTDPVAQIGYYRTVYPAFTGDQVLLERAEAEIMCKQYDAAAADMNMWLNNISKKKWNLTAEDINSLMESIEFSTWENSSVKKHLNAKFNIDEGLQENMIHFVLLLKRVDSYSQGLRWFDVKRYGIEIERRIINADGIPETFVDKLVVDDPRRAIQIPKKVIDAGYAANPR